MFSNNALRQNKFGKNGRFNIRIDKVLCSNPLDWMSTVKCSLNPSEFNLFVVILWWIWGERNNLVHGKTGSTPNSILLQAQNWLANWEAVKFIANKECCAQSVLGETIESLCWRSPNGNTVKVNVDASWFSVGSASGAGIIARNAQGEVLLSVVVPLNPSDSALVAELRALCAAIEVLDGDCFPDVILELDCLTLIQGLNNRECPSGANSFLFDDVMASCNKFQSLVFKHVNRACNSAAHELAKWASSLQAPCILVDY